MIKHEQYADCDGIAHWDVNPFVEEIYGEIHYEWMCDCEYREALWDI